MRAAFGLAGLLITIGVIIWIMKEAWLPYNQTVIKEGGKARMQASQIAGVDDATGMKITDSITLDAQSQGNRLDSILVTGIVIGGPMDKYFGLMRGDAIVEIGTHGSMQKVRDINDGELAKAWVMEAYQTKQPLTVIRNGQQLTLPQGPIAPAAAIVPKPKPTAAGSASPLQQQLDAIQNAPAR